MTQPIVPSLSEKVARFFIENTEHYRWEGQPLDLPNPQGKYICSIGPTTENGLLAASAENREKRIQIWAAALDKSGLLAAAEKV